MTARTRIVLATAGVAAGISAIALLAVRGGDQPVRRFLSRHVVTDGRVVRRSGDTVSEGQAYAMSMAVAVGDRTTFDAVWGWAKANLVQPEGYMGWHWADGSVVDVQPAPDADVDAAVALAVAADRFDRPELLDEARTLSSAILDHATAVVDGRLWLAAGPWALGDPMTVNPSYLDPASFELLASATGDGRWTRLADTSRVALESLSAGPRLIPDWAWLADGALRPIGSPESPGEEPLWGFEAFRAQVRLAASCSAEDRRLAARGWELLRRGGTATMGPRLLDGSQATDWSHPATLVGAAAAAHAAGDRESRDELLNRAIELEQERDDYYSTAWVALGKLMLSGELRRCA